MPGFCPAFLDYPTGQTGEFIRSYEHGGVPNALS
jgi:hypothetical protein